MSGLEFESPHLHYFLKINSMKLEITITNEKKTIKISESVNIKEFIAILKKEFSNNWEE